MATEIQVRNIGSDVRPRDIEHLFARFGAVRDVVMSEQSTGVRYAPEAIVNMGSEEQCRAAVQALNGHGFHGAFLELRSVQADPASGSAEARMFGPMNMSEGEAWDDDRGSVRGGAPPSQPSAGVRPR
jgi:hypothetical protein